MEEVGSPVRVDAIRGLGHRCDGTPAFTEVSGTELGKWRPVSTRPPNSPDPIFAGLAAVAVFEYLINFGRVRILSILPARP